jgi:hypothetical protein
MIILKKKWLIIIVLLLGNPIIKAMNENQIKEDINDINKYLNNFSNIAENNNTDNNQQQQENFNTQNQEEDIDIFTENNLQQEIIKKWIKTKMSLYSKDGSKKGISIVYNAVKNNPYLNLLFDQYKNEPPSKIEISKKNYIKKTIRSYLNELPPTKKRGRKKQKNEDNS